MEKHLDFSASEVLIMEAVNYAIHQSWLKLQHNRHGDIYPAPAEDMHRNIHPRVLKLNLDIGDIHVVPTDGAPGPEDLGANDWILVREDVLSGGDTSGKYQLSRTAVATGIVTADHRANPVSFYLRIVARGAPDNPDEGYKGHWWDWEVRGEVTEIETGQVTSIYIKNECLNDRSFQRVSGKSIYGHVVGIDYFTYGAATESRSVQE